MDAGDLGVAEQDAGAGGRVPRAVGGAGRAQGGHGGEELVLRGLGVPAHHFLALHHLNQ